MNAIKKKIFHKSAGIDGILVTVGLCIIALVLCVIMKDQLKDMITTIVTAMQTKAQGILSSTGVTILPPFVHGIW